MTLKSYRFKDKKRRQMKPAPKLKSAGEFVKAATGAILGVALLSQIGSGIRRI